MSAQAPPPLPQPGDGSLTLTVLITLQSLNPALRRRAEYGVIMWFVKVPQLHTVNYSWGYKTRNGTNILGNNSKVCKSTSFPREVAEKNSDLLKTILLHMIGYFHRITGVYEI